MTTMVKTKRKRNRRKLAVRNVEMCEVESVKKENEEWEEKNNYEERRKRRAKNELSMR